MNQIIMWIMAVGAVLGGVDRIAGNRFGLGKRFEEGFTLLGPTALSMSGIICLTPLLSRFLRFALVPIWNFFGLDAGLLAGILAIDMGGYQLAGELSASQEMVRYAGLVIAATLGCTITFTIPVGMGMLKSGDRLFFSRGMLIGTGTLPVTMIVGGLLSGLSFLQIVLPSLPVLLFCFLLTPPPPASSPLPTARPRSSWRTRSTPSTSAPSWWRPTPTWRSCPSSSRR